MHIIRQPHELPSQASERERAASGERPAVIAHFASRSVVKRTGGIPLGNFEQHWRSGEIGGYIRLYAPRLVGIEPRDPEGGSTLS